MMQTTSKLLASGLVLLALLPLAACSSLPPGPPSPSGEPTGFLIKSLPAGGRKYGLFVPQAYSPQRRWPVIVFLHGIGEAGGDPQSAMRVGLGPAIHDQQATFPFIVIFAQSHGGWDENSDAARDVLAALDQVKRDYSVNEDCVTLTGLSTGGYGTWALGARHKDKFSALVPMAAYSDHKDVDQLTDIPVWCFHNTGDPFVLAAGSHSMVNQINERGGHAEYTELFAPGHDCWSHAYSEDKLFNWMLQQRRNSAAARRNSTPTPPPVPTPVVYSSAAPSAPPPPAPPTPAYAAPHALATPALARTPRAAAPRPALIEPPAQSSSNSLPTVPTVSTPAPLRSAAPPAMLTPY